MTLNTESQKVSHYEALKEYLQPTAFGICKVSASKQLTGTVRITHQPQDVFGRRSGFRGHNVLEASLCSVVGFDLLAGGGTVLDYRFRATALR